VEDKDKDEVAGEVTAGAAGPGLDQEEATQEEDHCRKRFSATPMARKAMFLTATAKAPVNNSF
jgi:hypothetical protein